MPELHRAPLPEQIAAHYRIAIREGRLAPGDQLPANRAMVATWHASTGTVGRAVALLRDEGWVTVRPGRAPIVLGVPPVTW